MVNNLMMYWISSNNIKVHKRKVNKVIQRMNKNLREDSLWMGRFAARQTGYRQWVQYTDGSGWKYYVEIEMFDKLTKKTERFICGSNDLWWGNLLWFKMNTFITETCEAWCGDPRPGTEKYKEMINKLRKDW